MPSFNMIQRPSHSVQRPEEDKYNLDKNVGFLDHHISELELFANRVFPSCPFPIRGAFLAKASFFKITKPTPSPCGVDFANRVLAVRFRVRNLFSQPTLEPLAAFGERQSELMIETANMRVDEVNLIHEAKLAEEPDHIEENAVGGSAKNQEASTQTDAEGGETTQETHRPITPISPIPSPTVPFCLPILSLNTSTRHLITKEGTPPFTLTFNPGTRHYDLMDQSTHNPSYFLHTFHPLNLKIAAWAPGSLQVHTQTKDYVKKNGTGEFMNWGVQDVEGLEMLVEELKGSGVEALRMELDHLHLMLFRG